MNLLDRLKLGGLALQIARHTSVLLKRIGKQALKAILREVIRLEVEEPNLTGREKFDRLADYIRRELVEAVESIDVVGMLVSGLVAWFKGTGLFQSRSA